MTAQAAYPGPCEVHRPTYRHAPRNAGAYDWHHLMPRDWQRAAIDAGLVAEHTVDPVYGPVFEAAGVHVPPTCHRNVHAGIEALTREWMPGVLDRPWLAAARRAVRLDASVWAAAWRAVDLWRARGLDVGWLVERRLWGSE